MKLITALFILFSSMSFGQKIFRYIKKGNTKKVEQYIKKHQTINDTIFLETEYSEDNYYMLPLTYAIAENKLDIVKLFVKDSLKIPDFREQVSAGFALSMSVNNDALSNYLFDLKPNLSAVCLSCHEQSAIMIATVYGNKKWYFKLKPLSNLNSTNENGQNLMHLSIIGEFSQTIFDDLLLTPQLNLNLNDDFGNQPIDLALMEKKIAVFYKLESKLKQQGQKIEVSNASAALSGDLKIFKYVESNYFVYKDWENTHYYPEDTKNDIYDPVSYLLEDAIIGNNIEIVKLIYDRMLSNLKNEKDKTQKDYKAGILSSIINMRYIDSDATMMFSWFEYVVTENKNKQLFEFIITKSVEFNSYNFNCFHRNNIDRSLTRETAKIYFLKWQNKEAKKAFGKAYVDALYQKLNIRF